MTGSLGYRYWTRLVGGAVAFIAVLGVMVGGWFYWRLKGSLPVLDGRARVPGLAGEVRLERDALGVPTVHAGSFRDAARALGYAHGQDRFFQMDLARRRAAGELSALVGRGALPLDRRARLHDFRGLARQAAARLNPEQRSLLQAYAAGVNAGLASLAVKPFEYLLLRSRPDPWLPEDSLLVCYSMLLTLQDDTAVYSRRVADTRAVLGRQAAEFLAPLTGPGDAALDGSTAPLPPIPGADVIDLRRRLTAAAGPEPEEKIIGSNSLAIAGSGGAPAVLANDMHLTLSLPNTWYRASLLWPGHRLTGATLPGVPAVVVGSNGHIAWGLTNAGVATADLVAVDTDLEDHYLGPDGAELPFLVHSATIQVKGHADETVTSQWTVWGPVVGSDPAKPTRRWVMHWTEDDPAAADLNFIELREAETVDAALAIAQRSGIPAVNFLVADEHGRIGWTIAGRLPERLGYDGTARWPVSWQYGDRGWKGLLPPGRAPSVAGRDYLWTANERMLGGDGLKALGDNGYFRGARGAQLRDDLAALHGAAKPADLLRIELDDRAIFLGWWRDLILGLEAGDPDRAAHQPFFDAVRGWGGRAATDSVGYRLVREFRQRVSSRVLDPLFAPCAKADPDFQWSDLNVEPAVRAILTQRPMRLLDPRWPSWDRLLLGAVADGARVVSGHTWGQRNTLHIAHPFSRLLPGFLTGWLNLAGEPVPGDIDMPRVQSPDFGASERFAVAPGREAEGIFEMPGGQSGHPLSPYYRNSTAAWVRGEPSPFLPGPAQHVLLLQP